LIDKPDSGNFIELLEGTAHWLPFDG